MFSILKLLQLLCDNRFLGFQDYIRNQETENSSAKLTSVNMVHEVANVLIRFTELGDIVFLDFMTVKAVPQVQFLSLTFRCSSLSLTLCWDLA